MTSDLMTVHLHYTVQCKSNYNVLVQVSIDKCYNKRHYLRRIYTFARNNAAPRDNRSRLGAQQLWRHREW